MFPLEFRERNDITTISDERNTYHGTNNISSPNNNKQEVRGKFFHHDWLQKINRIIPLEIFLKKIRKTGKGDDWYFYISNNNLVKLMSTLLEAESGSGINLMGKSILLKDSKMNFVELWTSWQSKTFNIDIHCKG